MKFSNGCWLQKEGTECFTPAEVYFTKIEKEKVCICAPTHKINHRGDTLGGVNLTIHISAPMPEVLRIQTYHYMGTKRKSPSFELENITVDNMTEQEDDQKIIISSGALRLEIEKDNCQMTYYRGNEKITSSGYRDLAYMKTDWKGLAYDDGSDENTYMREQLTLSVGELIYGMGERFTPFIKNGQSIDIWKSRAIRSIFNCRYGKSCTAYSSSGGK